MAVITPYKGQLELLRRTCQTSFPAAEFSTVDGFQVGCLCCHARTGADNQNMCPACCSLPCPTPGAAAACAAWCVSQGPLLCVRAEGGWLHTQGKEADHVIFSCVRAQPAGHGSASVGFLADVRRMNVGLTRARSADSVMHVSAVLTMLVGISTLA